MSGLKGADLSVVGINGKKIDFSSKSGQWGKYKKPMGFSSLEMVLQDFGGGGHSV